MYFNSNIYYNLGILNHLDTEASLKLFLFFSLLLCSAFFSGSEVAFFSLDKKKINKTLSKNPLFLHYILALIEAPRRLLVTILIGNTFVNVSLSIIAVSFAFDIVRIYSISLEAALTIQIIILTVFVVLFGELTPKIWASKQPLLFSKIVVFPLYLISLIIYPVSEIVSEFIKFFTRKINFRNYKKVISLDDIPHLAEVGREQGTIEEDEHSIIKSIVSYKKVTAREIMRPRVDIKAISIDSTFDELMAVIIESGNSRIPLYKEDLDEIIGIIYAKDLLPFLNQKANLKQFALMKIARKALFIPESKLISDLMQEFQEKKMHIAIIVDEYGGTSGLITLEDIIEEIIGEIRDEYDKEEEEVSKINDKTFIVKGTAPIDVVNELLDINIESDEGEFETIGGFILSHSGMIPKEGYHLVYDGWRFSVKETSNKRILKILIEKEL